MLPHPCRILLKCTTFEGSNTHLSTFLKSPSNIAYQQETTILVQFISFNLDPVRRTLESFNISRVQVFDFVRNEEWYIPDLSMFNSMIMMLGKNKFIEMAEQLLVHMTKEGLQPDSRTYTELIGVYFRVDLVEKAMEMYELMKISGFSPDKLTMSILIRNLEKAEEKKLVIRVKKECADYIDYPEKFLKEIESTNFKRRSLDLV